MTRGRKATGTLPPPPKDWRGRPLAVLLGGSADPRWYFADDLDQIERAAAYSSLGWPYRRTNEHEPHPHYAAAGIVYRRKAAGELLREAAIARDAGLARTTEAHPDEFAAAVAIVTATAERIAVLSANDTRDAIEAAGIPGPVVGAAFRKAVADGLIKPTGERVKSTQRATHAHRIDLYRSLIRKDQPA